MNTTLLTALPSRFFRLWDIFCTARVGTSILTCTTFFFTDGCG
jgi:hypothetical protein